VTEIQYNIGTVGSFVTVYSYEYDAAGNLSSVTDHINDQVTMYRYDSESKLVRTHVYDASTNLNQYGSWITYDEQSRPKMVFHHFDYTVGSTTTYDSTSYRYYYDDLTGSVNKLTISGDYLDGTINYTVDNFGRATGKTSSFKVNGSNVFYNQIGYTYTSSGNNQSAQISKMTSGVGVSSASTTTTYNYTYDANGNITRITDSNGTVQNSYVYDDLGQLTRENNRATGKTYVYTYDYAGNITSKKVYAFTTGSLGTVQSTISYTYGNSTWKDSLTNFNGSAISYDTIGNPTAIGSKSLTWQGRELQRFVNGSTTVSYKYNADGIRTEKTVQTSSTTTRYEYQLNGSQIVKVLLVGAGFAQIKTGTSNFSFIMASNGDDLRNQMYIMYGIMLYNEDH